MTASFGSHAPKTTAPITEQCTLVCLEGAHRQHLCGLCIAHVSWCSYTRAIQTCFIISEQCRALSYGILEQFRFDSLMPIFFFTWSEFKAHMNAIELWELCAQSLCFTSPTRQEAVLASFDQSHHLPFSFCTLLFDQMRVKWVAISKASGQIGFTSESAFLCVDTVQA